MIDKTLHNEAPEYLKGLFHRLYTQSTLYSKYSILKVLYNLYSDTQSMVVRT